MNGARQLIEIALQKGVTLTTCESCTGGLLAVALTDVAGASAVFEQGVVTYSNAAKTDLVGVAPKTLAAHGAVSEEVAAEMATGARIRAKADLAISITGIAGPGGSDHKPEGRVCFGLATAAGCHTQTVEFGALGRAQVRNAARDHALAIAYDVLRTL